MSTLILVQNVFSIMKLKDMAKEIFDYCVVKVAGITAKK
jgi:hypothetical protein